MRSAQPSCPPLCLLLAATLALVGGCSDDDTGGGTPTGGAGSGAVGGTGGTSSPGGAAGDGGGTDGPLTRATITGDATWTVTFDDAAKNAGATDCTYTRHYEGAEDESAPWLCPACEVIFRVSVEMSAGLADCFNQVSETPPEPEEWVGYGGGTWWRGMGGPTSEQGTTTIDGNAITIVNRVEDLEATVYGAGTLTFDVSGTFTLGEEPGDPMQGWAAAGSYACGWPKANPAAYDGDYAVVVGRVLPDGLFHDRCAETVRLHDFQGGYLLVDMSAMDCPACQSMASEEEAFIASLAGQGITAYVITLMAPSLDDPIGDTTTAMLTNWTNQHDLSSPVLADRAWGVSMFLPLYPETLSYPSWILVAPDLTILDYDSGFTGFDAIEAAILDHAQ